MSLASILGFVLISTICFKNAETLKVQNNAPVVLEQKTAVEKTNHPEIINENVAPNQMQNKTIIIILWKYTQYSQKNFQFGGQ